MDRTIDNRDCPLYGTHYCELLHMRECGQCPLTRPSSDVTPESLRSDLDLYESLLPEGGVAPLFEAKTCRFCRDEAAARRRQGYAIFNMAHPEPKRMQNGLLFGKRRAAVGTMIPVQVAICPHCRRRLLLLEYLPVLLPLVVGAAFLLLLTLSDVGDALIRVAPVLPCVIWVGGMALAWGVAKLLRSALKRRFAHDMYVDILEHPTLRRMLEKGWFPVPNQGGVRPVFSKSRLQRGLGTAPSQTAGQRAAGTTPENH